MIMSVKLYKLSIIWVGLGLVLWLGLCILLPITCNAQQSINNPAGNNYSMSWPSSPGLTVCTGTPCTAWGTSKALVTTLANPGVDTNIPSEKSVRSAIASAVSGITAASLGLVIGTNVQAYSANLDSWSAITTASKQNSLVNYSTISSLTGYPSTFPPTNSGDWAGTWQTFAPSHFQNALTTYSTISSLSGYPSTFTPSAHASTHQNGGTDEVATATPGANVIPKTGAGSTLADGFMPSGITRTICSGTITPSGTLSSAAQGSLGSATCTGAASTDIVICTANSNIFAVTGFVPSTNGILTLTCTPSANTVTLYGSNNTSASITIGSIGINYRVTR
jgi:hypothetical protein